MSIFYFDHQLTAFWQCVGPRPSVYARSPAPPEEDEALVALEGHLLPRVEELLGREGAAVAGAAREAAVLAWKAQIIILCFLIGVALIQMKKKNNPFDKMSTLLLIKLSLSLPPTIDV